MLQIIGLLGCAYLLIKGMELLGSAARYRSMMSWTDRGKLPEEERRIADFEARGHGVTSIAGWLAIAASIVFAILLIIAGNEAQKALNVNTSYSDCLRSAQTVAEMGACSH